MSHFFLLLFFRTKWWSLLVEGLLSTRPTLSSFLGVGPWIFHLPPGPFSLNCPLAVSVYKSRCPWDVRVVKITNYKEIHYIKGYKGSALQIFNLWVFPNDSDVHSRGVSRGRVLGCGCWRPSNTRAVFCLCCIHCFVQAPISPVLCLCCIHPIILFLCLCSIECFVHAPIFLFLCLCSIQCFVHAPISLFLCLCSIQCFVHAPIGPVLFLCSNPCSSSELCGLGGLDEATHSGKNNRWQDISIQARRAMVLLECSDVQILYLQ